MASKLFLPGSRVLIKGKDETSNATGTVVSFLSEGPYKTIVGYSVKLDDGRILGCSMDEATEPSKKQLLNF